MPSSSPVKSLFRMAVWIFSKLNTVVTPWSLPEPTIQLPSGATSTPWGDLPHGRRYTRPGCSLGFRTFTPPISVPLPSAASFSAIFQSTMAM